MAKFCAECGSEIRDSIAFCTQCGAKAEPQGMPGRKPASGPIPQRTAPAAPQHTSVLQTMGGAVTEKAVSTGTFFGLIFLFSVPILGWLICLIVAFAARNENIRHFARAMLIWLVIALLIGALIGVAIQALITSITPYLEQNMGNLDQIGNSADLSELTDLIGQFGSLGDMMGELEGMIPTE